MTTILIKDPLRQAVEAASGGKQTVIYTPKGQPSFVTIFNKIDLSTLNPDLSGTHPAFIINGTEYDQIMIGTFQGSIIDGELVSQPWSTPESGNTIQNYRAAAVAAGTGCHLMTLPEWGLVAAMDNLGVQTLGNNSQGSSVADSTLKGSLISGGSGMIYTGSGPTEFRLNQVYNQVSDLVGNRFQICDGVRFLDGEIQVVTNNDAAQPGYDLGLTSPNWKAINGQTGALIAPTGTGTINTDYDATTSNSVKLASSDNPVDYGISYIQGAVPNTFGTNKIQTAAMNVLRSLGVVSISPTCTPRNGFDVSLAATTNKDLRWYRSGGPNHAGYASVNSVFTNSYVGDSGSFTAEGGTVRPVYYKAS